MGGYQLSDGQLTAAWHRRTKRYCTEYSTIQKSYGALHRFETTNPTHAHAKPALEIEYTLARYKMHYEQSRGILVFWVFNRDYEPRLI